jgi:anti-sigma B factor antagonist
MEIKVRSVQEITVVELVGELTWKTAPEAQDQIIAAAQPGVKMILDMSQVPFMSSAGLRLMLVVYRTVGRKGGKAVLVGLSPELESTMAVTGFLEFFAHTASLEAGIAKLTA